MHKVYNELSKVKVCEGSRYTCPYYTITQQGLQPNSKGNYVDCTPTNFSEVLQRMQNKTYTKNCERELYKYTKKHPDDVRQLKHWAASIYAFNDHRYTVEEKIYDENGKYLRVIRTNDAYNYWTGFKGYDFDPPKEKYNEQQRYEIGITLKKILYKELKKYNWFIGSGLSTGGHGTHAYTAIKLTDEYYSLALEEKIRWHDMAYWILFSKMIPCLNALVTELPYMTLEDAKEMLDTAMLKVGQTLNITPLDNDPLINSNFQYEELADIKSFFNATDKDYPEIPSDTLITLDAQEINNYNIFVDVCIGINGSSKSKNKKLADHYKNRQKTNVIINKCDDFDIHVLDNCNGPWHFEHKRKNGNKFWTGNQIIHTLSFFFTKNTIKNIWRHPKFYDCDPKDWIRFVDDPRWGSESYLPNFKLIGWLNKNCNMNLSFEIEGDTIDASIINLKDNEYIYDKKDELNSLLKPGVNLVESGTGTGKTTYVVKTYEENFINDNNPLNHDKCINMCVTEPYNSVIVTKFQKQADKGIVDIVKGSKRIKIVENRSNNVCTNYYHINLMKDEDIEKVDLLIIDESHLLFSEAYRFGSISKFIHKINKFKQVILMTGTPIYECKFFENVNRIIVNKKDPRKLTHEFIRFEPCPEIKFFNICVLSELVHTLVSNGRKVFIYDKDISLQNCKRFQSINSDLKIAIYHKKHADEISKRADMIYIDENHMLDIFDVIISSCYFSVGNDLYDEGKAAVIMVGMHIPSEIIQVDGRWRNMSEINTYTIIKSPFEEIYDGLDFNKLYVHKKQEITRIKDDYTIKDSSLSIFKKYKHVNDEDIPLLAYMETLPIHQCTIEFINNELSKYDVWCDERIMPLAYNLDYIEKNKKFSKELKDTRSTFRFEFINDLLQEKDVEWITTDNKLAVWQKTVYIMYNHINRDLFKDEIGWITRATTTDAMILFNKLNDKISNNDVDYAEVYAMVKTSENLVEKDYMLNEWLSHNYWECIKGYTLFVSYYNKNLMKKDIIKGDYFKEFTDMCFNYCEIPDKMKAYLFRNKGTMKNFDIFVEKFNGTIEQYVDIPGFDEYIDHFERSKYASKNYEIELMNRLLERFKNPKKFGGQIGSPKKKCVITDKMKPVKLEKYGLKVGQEFESMSELAKYVNLSPKSITEWKDKKWIEKR